MSWKWKQVFGSKWENVETYGSPAEKCEGAQNEIVCERERIKWTIFNVEITTSREWTGSQCFSQKSGLIIKLMVIESERTDKTSRQLKSKKFKLIFY